MVIERLIVAEPFAVMIFRRLWVRYDGQPVLGANLIGDTPDNPVRAYRVLKLIRAVQRSRIKNYMIMDMFFIYVRRHDESVAPFREPHGQLVP